jgi:Rrf2 family protein
MRLSRRVGYAVRALVGLAARRGALVPSYDVARDFGIPERMLIQVCALLVRAGILHSLRGHRGGYGLARPAAGIPLLEVVEAVEGTLRCEAVPLGGKAGAALDRRLEQACRRATQAERKVLAGVTVADLAGRQRRKKPATQPGRVSACHICGEKPASRRGCCASCYRRLAELVRAGVVTWAEMEQWGVILPAAKGGER